MALTQREALVTSTPPDPDVIPVRPGEEIDAAAVGAYVAGRLPGASGTPEIWQFPGGHANLTYLLHYPGGPNYVLRRPPPGDLPASAHDMGREYRVLSVLYQAFPPAPRAFLYCEDTSVIGRPFFVMERRRGTVVRREVPPEFGGGKDPVANRKLSQVMIDALADFHAVAPGAAGLETLGKPEGSPARQGKGWTDRWKRHGTRDVAAAPEVIGWLNDYMPPSPPPTLVHNDWRLDNMSVAEDDPGRCVAVYDWDMCTLGDPFTDLGTLLSSWFEVGEEYAFLASMPSRVPGFMRRDEAIARYAERSGRDVSRMPYYYVFGLFKMAGVVQQLFYRWHKGQTKDDRMAGGEAVAEGLIRLARAPIERHGRGATDGYRPHPAPPPARGPRARARPPGERGGGRRGAHAAGGGLAQGLRGAAREGARGGPVGAAHAGRVGGHGARSARHGLRVGGVRAHPDGRLRPQLPRARRRQHAHAPPPRRRRAEGALPPPAGRRQGPLLLRDDRAGGGGVGPDRHPHHGCARRRPLDPERPQVVHLGCARRGLRDRDREDGPRRPAAPGAQHGLSRRHGSAGLDDRARRGDHGRARQPLRDPPRGRARGGRGHPGRPGPGPPPRAGAPRPGPARALHALDRERREGARDARPPRARARAARGRARRQAAHPGDDGRVGDGALRGEADGAPRRLSHRARAALPAGGLDRQAPRGEHALAHHRPRHPGARRARLLHRYAAREHAPACALGSPGRRRRRGAPVADRGEPDRGLPRGWERAAGDGRWAAVGERCGGPGYFPVCEPHEGMTTAPRPISP